MTKSADWTTERDAAIQASKQAGQILVDRMGKVAVQFKGENDPVTEADHASQAAVRDYLHRRFPDDAMLGEEGLDERAGARRRWIVDPLDGTTNYVHNFPFFCVSLGLEVDGELVVGVIYDPVRKECFAAAAGNGATLNGVPMRVSATANLGESLLCVGMPTQARQSALALKVAAHLSARSSSLRRLGSAALSLAYVAAGRFDGFWNYHLHPWDAAAGVVIVREAGGRISNIHEPTYALGQPDVLATNGLIHPEMASEIAAQVDRPVQ